MPYYCMFIVFCEIFSSYAMYYENLLRHQHQLLYMKEQVCKTSCINKKFNVYLVLDKIFPMHFNNIT